MKQTIANYCVVEANGYFVVLKDLGPWDEYPTITNSAENVVAKMYEDGIKDQRIIYFDSEDDLTELKHDGKGHFRAFGSIGAYPFVVDAEIGCGHDTCSD